VPISLFDRRSIAVSVPSSVPAQKVFSSTPATEVYFFSSDANTKREYVPFVRLTCAIFPLPQRTRVAWLKKHMSLMLCQGSGHEIRHG